MFKKQRIFSGIIFFSLLLLVAPQIVLATPLSGADTDVSKYFFYNMIGGYTDDTTDANDANDAGDVMWGSNPTDNLFIGAASQFTKIYFQIDSAAESPSFPISIYYWNGATWVWSQTTNHPFGSTGIQYLTLPDTSGWVTNSVNSSSNYYYIKIEGSGLTGAAIGQVSVYVGGETTPEFPDYLYIATLIAGGWYGVNRMKKFQTDRIV